MVIVINNSDKEIGLYSGGLIFGGGGLIFGMRLALVHVVALYTGGGLIFGGGLYSEVYGKLLYHYFLSILDYLLQEVLQDIKGVFAVFILNIKRLLHCNSGCRANTQHHKRN